jgi:hypothetical protein
MVSFSVEKKQKTFTVVAPVDGNDHFDIKIFLVLFSKKNTLDLSDDSRVVPTDRRLLRVRSPCKLAL